MNILQKLIERKELTSQEARALMNGLMKGDYTNSKAAALLTALRIKGENKEEIVEFARVMRENAITIHPKVHDLVDTCGTGGDSTNSFNISTTAAFVAAGAGVKIAKHGNRSVSSSCGSADVLEQLGAKMLQPNEVEKCIEKIGIGFMFAPYFHPSMKNVAIVRKELGIRTVFNILGPLTNPAGANAQILGVFDQKLSKMMADVLGELGVKRAFIVNSNGMDEIGLGITKICELKDGKTTEYEINGKEFGFETREMAAVQSKEEGAKIITDVLNGEKGAARDITILNAAGAIYVSGKVDSFANSIEYATNSIDSGNAMKKLEEIIKFGERNFEVNESEST
ncbi:MAG: anthranilate phosphoribosyltransferase [Candidatus Micrarchaeota archaeon]